MLGLIRSLRDRFVDRIYQWLIFAEQRDWARKEKEMTGNLKQVGSDFRLTFPFQIHAPHEVSVGDNIHIGRNCFIRGEGGLTIGSNTIISRNLVLYTVNHRYEGDRIPYDEVLEKKPVVIGNNVWIGMNVCIAPGTNIGDGAIIALGSVVSGTIQPGEIVGQPRFRVLKNRDPDRYHRLVEDNAISDPWGKPLK